MKTKKQEKVIVRMWCKDPKNAILFFPERDNAQPGMIASWEHIGQHGEADPFIMRKPHTRPATKTEAEKAVFRYEQEYNCKGLFQIAKRLNWDVLRKNWKNYYTMRKTG